MLNPRFKLDFYYDSTLSEVVIRQQKKSAKVQLYEQYNSYCKPDSVPNSINPIEISTISRIVRRLKLTGNDDEVKTYLYEYPRIDSSMDPISWWENHITFLPNLAKMARYYLAIPGTSFSSEQAFSAC